MAVFIIILIVFAATDSIEICQRRNLKEAVVYYTLTSAALIGGIWYFLNENEGSFLSFVLDIPAIR